jgi:hypothetical protein
MRVSAASNCTGGPNPQAAAAASGSGIADLLLGAATVSNGIVEREDYNHPYFAAFVQDEFRVTSDLTLTYGVRYNVEPSWSEAQNRLAFIDTPGAGVFHHAGAQFGFERATAGSSRITTSLSTQPDGVTPLFNLQNPLPGGLLPVVGTSQGVSARRSVIDIFL